MSGQWSEKRSQKQEEPATGDYPGWASVRQWRAKAARGMRSKSGEGLEAIGLGAEDAGDGAKVAFFEAEAGVDPGVDDSVEFGAWEGVDVFAGLQDALDADTAAGVFFDPGLDGGLALAVGGEDIDDAHFVELGGGEDISGEEQLFGGAGADAAGEKAVATHAGKQIQEDLGETERGGMLGDDEVGGESEFEAAAEGLALHEGDGGESGAGVVVGAGMDIVDAEAGIMIEAGAVGGADKVEEEREVAAETEDLRHGGSGDVGVDLVFDAVQFEVEGVGGKFLVVAVDVVEEAEVEAGDAAGAHVAPEGAGGGIELAVAFLPGSVAYPQTGRVVRIAHERHRCWRSRDRRSGVTLWG
jgi:hypothetical protein